MVYTNTNQPQPTGQDVQYLSDQSWVAHGWRQTDSQPLQVAVDEMWFGDEAEGTQVAQTYSCQDDVAELTAGRLDHRCVPEPTEQSDYH